MAIMMIVIMILLMIICTFLESHDDDQDDNKVNNELCFGATTMIMTTIMRCVLEQQAPVSDIPSNHYDLV